MILRSKWKRAEEWKSRRCDAFIPDPEQGNERFSGCFIHSTLKKALSGAHFKRKWSSKILPSWWDPLFPVWSLLCGNPAMAFIRFLYRFQSFHVLLFSQLLQTRYGQDEQYFVYVKLKREHLILWRNSIFHSPFLVLRNGIMRVIQFLHKTRLVVFSFSAVNSFRNCSGESQSGYHRSLGHTQVSVLIGLVGVKKVTWSCFSESPYCYSLCHSNDHFSRHYLLHCYTKTLKLLFSLCSFSLCLQSNSAKNSKFKNPKNQNVNPRNPAIPTPIG